MSSPFKYIAQAIAINILLIAGYIIATRLGAINLQRWTIGFLTVITFALLARVIFRARKLKG